MLINNILWILYAVKFSLLCWTCTLARQESDKTGDIIYKILLNYKPKDTKNQSSLEILPENQDAEQNSNRSSSYNVNYIVMEKFQRKILDQKYVRNEVNDFSIQLQQHQHRVTITACNFFEMNNALLTGVSIYDHYYL